MEFKLARPRLDALRAATRKLQRVLGEEAPTLEQLIAYQFSRRDARLVAHEFVASGRGRGQSESG